ncbi:serine-rich adhesin for platelets [Labrus bergylta]|uniref:serine-rich adhesin for platelets n=1 Tax=Labrus bergylta TaxID=56723 RepID=UPI0033132561
MSKRGRRRSSRRRKSSSSSKQSVSPYIFHKHSQRNSVSYRDDVVEKGEADSLRKENAPSGSEDEDKNNNAPPKEKRFKQDDDSCSDTKQRSVYTKTTEDTERGVKIVTSISVNDEANPKITFLQSHQHFSGNKDDPMSLSAPITNIMNINCSASHVRLEIHELLHMNTAGIKTTFLFRNQKTNADQMIHNTNADQMIHNTNADQMIHNTNVDQMIHNTNADQMIHNTNADQMIHNTNVDQMIHNTNADQMIHNTACGKSWTANNESHHVTNHSSDNSFTFGSVHSDSACISSDSAHRLQRSEFMLETPPPVFRLGPAGKRKHFKKGASADDFWDIPPPREFSDLRVKVLDELTQDLSSCRLSERPLEELRPPHITCQDYSQYSEGRSPSFDQVSEPDSFEPSLIRPSLSTNRSSFTRDFISGQHRKSWIRNNSIAAVRHRTCSIPMKRRQTYPGTSGGLSLNQDLLVACAGSLSSLMMSYDDTESAPPDEDGEDGVSAFRTGSLNSLHSRGLKQILIGSYYLTSSDDAFTVTEESGGASSVRYNVRDVMQSVCVDHRELADSGFDQEMGEGECHSLYPPTEEEEEEGEGECHSLYPPTEEEEEGEEEEELCRRSLMIQVIPPSCSGSEEHILSHPDQQDSHLSSPGLRRSSGSPVSAGVLQQRLLQVDGRLSPSACLDKHHSKSAVDSRKNSLSTHEDPEQTCPPESAETEETEDGPSGSASSPVRGSAESGEQLSPTCRADKHTTSRTGEHLKPGVHKEADCNGSDHWAKRRKLFRESKQWSSAAGSSITSSITEESVSEETRSMDVSVGDGEDRGFYTETFHASTWIYQGDDISSGSIPPSLNTRTRAVSIRERTVRISKGAGEYPWGFRIQFSKPIVVTEVDTNGAAEEAGLIVGDYVLAVNGTDVTSIPHSEAAELARQGPDDLTLTVGSDIARCPNTPRPACRGYLHKRTQSGLIKGWRRRWFVLTHDCCLYYYRHKRDEGKGRALLGVKLEGAEVGADVSLGKPFVFKCRPQSGNRVFFFCAMSNQEMKRWLEAMEKAVLPITQKHVWVDVTLHNSSLPPLAVKSPECLGLLHKMDKSRDMWVQHYCILKDGCLSLYSGIRATHAQGGIYLQGYQVREQPYGSKKSTIELKPPCDEFKTFYLCAENPNENKRWIIALRASIKKWLPLHQALQDYMSRLPEETRM